MAHLKACGISAAALTDINNTSGCIDFMRLALKYDVTPVIGIDFRQGVKQLFIGIARNIEGFRELNEFLSKHKMEKTDIPHTPPRFTNVYVIYPWHKGIKRKLSDNEYVGLRPSDIAAFRLHGAKEHAAKAVALATLTFRDKRDFNTHRLLRAIGDNVLLSKLGTEAQGRLDDMAHPHTRLLEIYGEFPQALVNAQRILEQSKVDFSFGTAKNKKRFLSSDAEDYDLLERLSYQGLLYRYGAPDNKTRNRLAKEMEMISELGFTAYFLINWDLLQYARSKGYFHIGRGSGANSIVAYCLGITDVDPIELDLYFERFINPSRKSPPDFDIDFSHTDRDDIRRYMHDKYPGCTALVGSYNTFERRSCIRELGKVFGLPDGDIETLQTERRQLKDADTFGKLVLMYAPLIHGLPNLLSVHACGVLISELPMTYYTALELLPVGFPSTQFSMLEAEDVGLYKFDILSQRGLGHIKDAVVLVKENRGLDIDIHDIPRFKEDPVIKQLLKSGDTIGCFYVESPAMRQLLRKLEVEDYLGLVAASSVIRPGVSSSGMMRKFIERYRFPEKRKESHPVLLELMPDTFGVMVYQEDVIKVAHLYAGLTLEESDVMRRGMSGKFRSREEFQRVKEKYFENCKAKGYPEEDAAEIWRQIESFAGYSFAKGHSASFAVESYQSLYLRAHHPIEFMTAVLNNFGGFYSTEFYLHEARMLGANVELPCVNMSNDLAVLEGKTIYMGLCLIKDLEHGTREAILRERERAGEFTGLNNFLKRIPISLEQVRILIRIQAFRFTGRTSKELLWDAHFFYGKTKKTVPKVELFAGEAEPTELPELEYKANERALDEMKILGFPHTNPFSLLKHKDMGTIYADELMANLGNVVYIVGYFVADKLVRTVNGDNMFFGCFTDSKGKLFDTVHFPHAVKNSPSLGRGVYLIKGTVVQDFDVPSVEVVKMERIEWAF